MAELQGIFAKSRLTPGQWRAVAERRFGDASYLVNSRNAERATGGMYMCGFVIECLLKALLLERHPNLGKPVDRAKLSPSDREVHSLLYSHDLDDMLGFLPEIEKKLHGVKTKAGESAWRTFTTICEEWTVYARYSTRIAKLDRAEQFIETIEEVKKWLKEL